MVILAALLFGEIPVVESDFAVSFPLLAASQADLNKNKQVQGKERETVSGWLWVVIVTIIPALVWQQFGSVSMMVFAAHLLGNYN